MRSGARHLRYLAAMTGAAIVTFGLFGVMQQLISPDPSRRGEAGTLSGIHFGKVQIPQEIANRSRRKPPPPPPAQDPPPPPRLQIAPSNSPVRNLPEISLPNLQMPILSGMGPFIGNQEQVARSAEGDIVPIVVIRPMYPREAAISGTEGWVKVEFTITETGAVENPRVVDAEPPRVFNREAIRAILKWKFKPRVVEGVAVERQATQVIDFTLDDPGR